MSSCTYFSTINSDSELPLTSDWKIFSQLTHQLLLLACSSPRKDKTIKHHQKKKKNPSEQSSRISNPKEDPSWRQKELIPRCQWENFAPKKFEIQIWVWNFVRRIEYSMIWRNGFPLCKAHFSSEPTKWKADRRWYAFKNLRPTPGPTNLFD